MFLTFIVPVYNAERYIAECLDSLLNQDLLDQDYEIICVNDGSTDNSLAILNEYASHHANLLVKSVPNGGVSNARNTGLSLARGSYIWFVDSDDFIMGNILREIRKTIEDAQPDILFFGAYSFHDSLSTEELASYRSQTLHPSIYANHVYSTHSIFKTDFLLQNQITFCTDLRFSEDSLFSMTCLVHKPKTVLIRKAYYMFRYNDGSATTHKSTTATKAKIDSLIIATNQFYHLYMSCDVSLKCKLADLITSNLCFVTSQISCLPREDEILYLQKLTTLGLFPFAPLPECTLTRSSQIQRNDWIGTLYDQLWLHSFTKIGYWKMKCWNRLYKLYSHAKNHFTR